MIRGPAFYKLLGIDESVTEPTAYHLLALDPRTIGEARVDRALKDRKARLRQNIPGPQFIPIVSLIERELEKAAEILRDPLRRKEYDQRLVRRSHQKPPSQGSEQRRELVSACREAVRSMVDSDGCLPEAKRAELADRLERLGLPANQIHYVLEHIPRPAGDEVEETPEQIRQAHDEAMAFFATAIELEVDGELLDETGQRKLMRMARRCGIDEDLAEARIEEHLASVGARRGERPDSTLTGQFKLQVLAMFPMGDATEIDRRRLLALARAQGLSTRQAEKILREYVPSPSDRAGPDGPDGPDDVALAADPLAVLEGLADGPAVSRPAGRPDEVGNWMRYAVDVLIALVLAATVIGVWKVVDPGPVVQTVPAYGTDGLGPTSAPASEHERLLAEALASADSPAKIHRLFETASEEVRDKALRGAAELLLSPTPPQREQAEELLKALFHGPPASKAVQEAAMGAVMDRLGGSVEAGPLDPKRAYRAAGLLAGVLLLRPTPGVPVDDPNQMRSFLSACRRSWDASRKANPNDPVNDPQRLAAAVIAGGALTTYGARSDPTRFAAVCSQLAPIAADAARPGSGEALTALLASGGYGGYRPGIEQAARLALCDVIESASEARIATRAQATLVSVLKLPFDDSLRGAPIGGTAQRVEAAERFRRAVRGIEEIAVATQPTVPATKPAPEPAKPEASALARKVRSTWSKRPDTSEALTNTATALLACADQTARLAIGSKRLANELLTLLNRDTPDERAAWLIRRVRLAERMAGAGAEAAGGDSPLDTKLAEQLKHELRSPVPGVRDRAIEQLRVLDDAAAMEMILERLTDLMRSTGPDLPTMNRLLRALETMSDGRVPTRLAALIAPARSNYVAHRIVTTLLEGTGYVGNPNAVRYQLPMSHNSRQRSISAGLWQSLAVSCAWGPNRMPGGVAGSIGPPPAWQPDPTVEKLLALTVYYSRLSGQLLQTYKPAGDGDAPEPPALDPSEILLPAGPRDEELLEAIDLLVGQLTRLARAHGNGRDFAVKLDMIALAAQARRLACDTALQSAAVGLETAGKVLEILVLAGSSEATTAEAVEAARQQRAAAVIEAENVLVEMREHGYYNLVLLELLPKEEP